MTLKKISEKWEDIGYILRIREEWISIVREAIGPEVNSKLPEMFNMI